MGESIKVKNTVSELIRLYEKKEVLELELKEMILDLTIETLNRRTKLETDLILTRERIGRIKGKYKPQSHMIEVVVPSFKK